MALCPGIPEPLTDLQDDWSGWGAEMIDLYSACAKRHRALVDWVNQ